MKNKFVLKFEDFIKSPYYKEFESVRESIMSFDEFSKSQSSGKSPCIIVMTFDLSGTKRYYPIKKFLKQNKFQTQLPDGRCLTRNTYLLLVTGINNQIVSALKNSIVTFIKSQYKGKRFRVFICETNNYLLHP
jgi:hypothetical protein